MRGLGIVLALLGAFLLIFSLLADTLRIGGAPLFFGWKQILGVISGTVLILLGFILCLPKIEKLDGDNNSLNAG